MSTSDLRTALSRAGPTGPAIQKAAAAMVRQYDRGAAQAVNEWRSALQAARPDQLLPLLYVANEVLQTSKRNRGPRFLEAFAAVLGQSLRYVCERDRGLVEKVRRTAKIWGDRQVYSPRFVSELLAGLEDLRGGGGQPAPLASAPLPVQQGVATATAAAPPPAANGGSEGRDGAASDSPFGFAPSEKLLDIDITASASSARSKRRLGNTAAAAAAAASSPAKKKRRPVKSKENLLNLLDALVSLDGRYRSAQAAIAAILPAHLDEDGGALAEVVGDELLDLNRGAAAAGRTLRGQGRELHAIATDRRRLEGEVAAYISWLRAALKGDEEELAFCSALERDLEGLAVVHGHARKQREARRGEEARRRAAEEAERRKREETEERKRSLEEVIKGKDNQEAKPGMVWNPQLREYQEIGDVTSESWRD